MKAPEKTTPDLNFDGARKDKIRVASQIDCLVCVVYDKRAAAHPDGNILALGAIAVFNRRNHGSARTGAAGKGLAVAAFPNAHF